MRLLTKNDVSAHYLMGFYGGIGNPGIIRLAGNTTKQPSAEKNDNRFFISNRRAGVFCDGLELAFRGFI
jgi:hypothetical protein